MPCSKGRVKKGQLLHYVGWRWLKKGSNLARPRGHLLHLLCPTLPFVSSASSSPSFAKLAWTGPRKHLLDPPCRTLPVVAQAPLVPVLPSAWIGPRRPSGAQAHSAIECAAAQYSECTAVHLNAVL
eukprot:1142848-Pelagomonas_calceolata.AAC.1